MDVRRLLWIFLVVGVVMLGTIPAPAGAAILKKGEPAPPIKVVTTAGQQVTLANYKGNVLVMDFFATWCAPCKEAIPHLSDLTSKYGKQGLQVLGMSIDDGDAKTLKDFILNRKINYPVGIVDQSTQLEYGLRSIPTVYVINKKGVVAEKYMGFSDSTGKSMETLIKKLLAE